MPVLSYYAIERMSRIYRKIAETARIFFACYLTLVQVSVSCSRIMQERLSLIGIIVRYKIHVNILLSAHTESSFYVDIYQICRFNKIFCELGK